MSPYTRMTRDQRAAIVRVAKQEVKLATSGLDPSGLIAMYLDEIPIRISMRPSRTLCGFFRGLGAGDVGYIVVNANLCHNEARFRATLIHELAHAINHWAYGDEADVHGPRWQSIMRQLGQEPSRTLKVCTP